MFSTKYPVPFLFSLFLPRQRKKNIEWNQATQAMQELRKKTLVFLVLKKAGMTLALQNWMYITTLKKAIVS